MQKRDLIIKIKSGKERGKARRKSFRVRNDGKILSHHRYEDTIY